MRNRARGVGHGATAFVIATGVTLVAFAVWCLLLISEVSSLRGDVETRVGWLQELTELQQRAQREGLDAEGRAQLVRELDELSDGIAAVPDVGSDLRAVVAVDARPDVDPALRISRMVPRIRAETGELSTELGKRWSNINWLAGIALFLAASTLGLLIYVRFVLLKQARRQVTTLEAHLRDADRLVAVGTLAAGVAHEINNPLTYVLSNLQTLQLDLGDSRGEQHELIEEALRGTERIRGIVRDLRAVARPTRDDVSACNVEECLDAALNITRTEMKRVAVVKRNYAGVPPVMGSDARLAQLFLNLVINAIHAMAKSDRSRNELTVTTRRDDDDGVEIEIRDTGPGVPPEIAHRVFEPFVTSKPLGEGTGLGLFVCHNIVESLDGSIDLRSDESGTVALVRLPIAPQSSVLLRSGSETAA